MLRMHLDRGSRLTYLGPVAEPSLYKKLQGYLPYRQLRMHVLMNTEPRQQLQMGAGTATGLQRMSISDA